LDKDRLTFAIFFFSKPNQITTEYFKHFGDELTLKNLTQLMVQQSNDFPKKELTRIHLKINKCSIIKIIRLFKMELCSLNIIFRDLGTR
jgi:hypothetical protein